MALYVHVKDAFGRNIGMLEIRNDGTGDPQTGNYDVSIVDLSDPVANPPRTRIGEIKGHDRADGPWPLVRLAADAMRQHQLCGEMIELDASPVAEAR